MQRWKCGGCGKRRRLTIRLRVAKSIATAMSSAVHAYTYSTAHDTLSLFQQKCKLQITNNIQIVHATTYLASQANLRRPFIPRSLLTNPHKLSCDTVICHAMPCHPFMPRSYLFSSPASHTPAHFHAYTHHENSMQYYTLREKFGSQPAGKAASGFPIGGEKISDASTCCVTSEYSNKCVHLFSDLRCTLLFSHH